MRERTLKIADISLLTGLQEKEIREFTQQYGECLPSKKIGPVRLYNESAVGIIKEIAELSDHGFGKDEIIQKIGKGANKGVGKRPLSVPEETKRLESHGMQHSIESRPLPHKSAMHVENRIIHDRLALQERQIDRLREHVLEQERMIEELKGELAQQASLFTRQLHDQQTQIRLIDEWIEHFQRGLEQTNERVKEHSERVQHWIDYFEEEIDILRGPLLDRLMLRLRR